MAHYAQECPDELVVRPIPPVEGGRPRIAPCPFIKGEPRATAVAPLEHRDFVGVILLRLLGVNARGEAGDENDGGDGDACEIGHFENFLLMGTTPHSCSIIARIGYLSSGSQ